MNYKQSDNINDVIVHSVFYSSKGGHIVTPINCGYNDKYIRKCIHAFQHYWSKIFSDMLYFCFTVLHNSAKTILTSNIPGTYLNP